MVGSSAEIGSSSLAPHRVAQFAANVRRSDQCTVQVNIGPLQSDIRLRLARIASAVNHFLQLSCSGASSIFIMNILVERGLRIGIRPARAGGLCR